MQQTAYSSSITFPPVFFFLPFPPWCDMMSRRRRRSMEPASLLLCCRDPGTLQQEPEGYLPSFYTSFINVYFIASSWVGRQLRWGDQVAAEKKKKKSCLFHSWHIKVVEWCGGSTFPRESLNKAVVFNFFFSLLLGPIFPSIHMKKERQLFRLHFSSLM